MGNQQGAYVYPHQEAKPTDLNIKIGPEETLFYDFVHRPKTTDFAGNRQRDHVSFLYRLPICIVGTLNEKTEQNNKEFYLHSLSSLIMLPTDKQPYVHQWKLSKQ